MKIFFSLIIIVIMSSCSNENSDEPHEASPEENIQISDENNSNLDDEDSNPDEDNSVSSQENKTPVEIIKLEIIKIHIKTPEIESGYLMTFNG